MTYAGRVVHRLGAFASLLVCSSLACSETPELGRDAGEIAPPSVTPHPNADASTDAAAAHDAGAFPPDADLPDASGAPDSGTVPSEPPPGSIYADALAEGWNLNDWGWASEALEVASPARGARSIAVAMNRSWCGFALAHGGGGRLLPFDPGTHEALHFALHTGATPDRLEQLEVRLNNGSGSVRVRDWIEGPIPAERWIELRIPLGALNSRQLPYSRIEWVNASTSTYAFTLDDVTLVPAGPPEPEPPLPLGSVGVAPIVSAGQSGARYSWIDAAGRPRSADFVDDSYRGGYIRALRYETAPGVVREAHGGVDPSTGYQGFGYLVSHYETGSNRGIDSADSRDGDYSASLKNNGHSSLLWHGKHHAIRQYQVDLHPQLYQRSGRGTVHATVHWLVASGRSSLVFSVTFDSSANDPDSVVADSRAPYGAIAWDGRGGSEAVTGVAWGDKHRFVADAGTDKLNVKSAWTYTASNVVPFNAVWAAGSDAEMGLVDTRSWARSVSAGDLGVWFDAQGRVRGSQRIDLRCWTRTSETASNCADPTSDGAGAKMPVTWAWPFQSINYGLGGQGTTGKKVAWGTSYGAIGHRNVLSFGERSLSGYPYTSYTTQVVLGTHGERAVFAAVAAQEAALATRVVAEVGNIRSEGSPGVGRPDLAAFENPGFDPVYGAFAARADANGRCDLRFESGARTLQHPLVSIDDVIAEPKQVLLDGVPLIAEVDYYASVQGTRAWITVNRDLTGTHSLSVHTR